METYSGGAEAGSGQAHADLAVVEAAQDAVRNKPWPVWLYVFNTVALVAYPLAMLDLHQRPHGIAVLSGAILAVNMLVGMRLGTPLAVPRLRGFLVPFWGSVGSVAVGCVAAAVGLGWLAVVGSIGAGLCYALASVNHWRATRVRR